jgi:hypothetical protein
MRLDNVAIASSQDFPDALCGGPFAGKNGSPIVLATNKEEVANPSIEAIIRGNGSKIKRGYVLGSTTSISSKLMDYIISVEDTR